MPSRSFRILLSASAQTVFVQLLGMGIFYINSVFLSKETFGEMNGMLAASAIFTAVLSGGLEQVAIRRMASGQVRSTLGSFLTHAVVSSMAVGGILLLAGLLGYRNAGILGLFFAGQALFFIAAPLRGLLAARELYGPYAGISLASNLLKIAALLALHYWQQLSLASIGLVLAAASLLELIALFLRVRREAGASIIYKFKLHTKLLREALPHYGSLLFDAALSRADWLLMSVLATAVATAEYSFAFRAFEVLKMPLVIIGTLLLSRLARWLAGSDPSADQILFLQRLAKLEVVVSFLLLLLATGLWQTVLNPLTGDKYGTSNASTFYILSFCLPMHFLINLMWTVSFCRQQYRLAARATLVTATVNLLLNAVLIPHWGGEGAAWAYLAATVIQFLLYLMPSGTNRRIVNSSTIYGCIIVGGAAFLTGRILPLHNDWIRTALVAAGYLLACGLCFPVLRKDLRTLYTQMKQ